MMTGIYGFGGGYSESARRKAAGLNDDGSFMPGYQAGPGGIYNPAGQLVNSKDAFKDAFTAPYKGRSLSSLVGGALGGGTFTGVAKPYQVWANQYVPPATGIPAGGGQNSYDANPLSPMPTLPAWATQGTPTRWEELVATGQAPKTNTNIPVPAVAGGMQRVLSYGNARQAGQGVQLPQSAYAYTLADLLRNYYA